MRLYRQSYFTPTLSLVSLFLILLLYIITWSSHLNLVHASGLLLFRRFYYIKFLEVFLCQANLTVFKFCSLFWYSLLVLISINYWLVLISLLFQILCSLGFRHRFNSFLIILLLKTSKLFPVVYALPIFCFYLLHQYQYLIPIIGFSQIESFNFLIILLTLVSCLARNIIYLLLIFSLLIKFEYCSIIKCMA